MMLAMSGDVEGAIDYAEQVGPKGFQLFGNQFLEKYRPIPELEEHPRWAAFKERCRVRWQAEIDKFDRLLASGDIVLP
jgi:hypothetical protein